MNCCKKFYIGNQVFCVLNKLMVQTGFTFINSSFKAKKVNNN